MKVLVDLVDFLALVALNYIFPFLSSLESKMIHTEKENTIDFSIFDR